MEHLHILVLAGGSGTRFWPWSRRSHPKQFLPLGGRRSLLQETLDRVAGLAPPERTWIVTRHDLAEKVRSGLPRHPRDRILSEPEGRDTAPGIVLGMTAIARVAPRAEVLVLPSDHRIEDHESFRAEVRGACAALRRHGGLFTFGVPPSRPATGYGYIERGEELPSPGPPPVRCSRAVRFREKPDLPTATRYLESGRYVWNAGIFLWSVEGFREELRRNAPELAAGAEALSRLGDELHDPVSPDLLAAFRSLPRISIDYALLERSKAIRVVEARFSWDDMGSWASVERIREADAAGNRVEGEALIRESRGCTVLAGGGRMVAVLGGEDLLVVDTPDALLVCPRARAEEVRGIVEELRSRGRDDLL